MNVNEEKVFDSLANDGISSIVDGNHFSHNNLYIPNNNPKTTTISMENTGAGHLQGPFKCDMCEKAVEDRYSLQSHQLIHPPIKPWICSWPDCVYICKTKGCMERHYRCHTDERPYVCHICSDSFRESGALTRHLRSKVSCSLKKKNGSHFRRSDCETEAKPAVEEGIIEEAPSQINVLAHTNIPRPEFLVVNAANLIKTEFSHLQAECLRPNSPPGASDHQEPHDSLSPSEPRVVYRTQGVPRADPQPQVLCIVPDSSLNDSEHQLVCVTPAGSSLNTSEPGSSLNTSEPGSSLNTSEPGSSLNTSEPGSSLNTSEPGSSHNTSEPQLVYLTEGDSLDYSEPHVVFNSDALVAVIAVTGDDALEEDTDDDDNDDSQMFCGNLVMDSMDAEYRLMSHTMCAACDEQFDSEADLMFHLRRHLSKTGFYCFGCNYTTRRKNAMLEHIKITRHMPDSKDAVEKILNTPDVEEDPFKDIDEDIHMSIAVTAIEQLLKLRGAERITSVIMKDGKTQDLYGCPVCEKRFSLSYLKQHINLHTGAKLHTCPRCPKSFTSRDALCKHLPVHSDHKSFCCGVCHKMFRRVSHIKEHLKVHADIRPFTCHICSKAFKTSNACKVHLRTHGGEPRHQCHTCAKLFREKAALDRHMRTHTGEKPYQCRLCGRCFAEPTTLKRHLKAKIPCTVRKAVNQAMLNATDRETLSLESMVANNALLTDLNVCIITTNKDTYELPGNIS